MQRREFLVFTSLLIAGCATKPSSPPQAGVGMRFSEAERKIITNFYSSAGGLARTGKIPVQRAKAGDLLDSGQRPNKLPTDLDKLLPHLQDPFTRLVLGSDVVLVNRNSHVILDVIPQIAF